MVKWYVCLFLETSTSSWIFFLFQQTWFINKVDQVWQPIWMEANQKIRSMHKTFEDDFKLKMVKEWNKKRNAPSSTTHTEKSWRQPSALATASLSRNTLSREFIRLIKMKVLKLGIWSSRFMIWAFWTHHLVACVRENKCMDTNLQCCF